MPSASFITSAYQCFPLIKILDGRAVMAPIEGDKQIAPSGFR